MSIVITILQKGVSTLIENHFSHRIASDI